MSTGIKRALRARTGPLWAEPLWPPWASASPPGPLWAGPSWPPWALVGRALVGPPEHLWPTLRPCGPSPCGLSPCEPLWPLVGPPGPLWARPLWASLGPHGPGPTGPPEIHPGAFPRTPHAPWGLVATTTSEIRFICIETYMICVYIHVYEYIWHFLICCLVQNAPLGPKKRLLCHTAGIVCCVAQQTCLLHDTGDMSAV